MKRNLQYLIYGRGRLGSHLAAYFDLLKIGYNLAGRSDSSAKLSGLLGLSTHVLICVPDRAIVETYMSLRAVAEGPQFLHFSGSLHNPELRSVHPLAAFSNRSMDLNEYASIAFAVFENRPLSSLLPGLPNPYFFVHPENKPLYHCLCVLLANGTTVLWEQTLNQLAPLLKLDPQLFSSYLNITSKNISWGIQNDISTLTGPWVRQDTNTTHLHSKVLSGLAGSPVGKGLEAVYQELQNLAPKQRSSPVKHAEIDTEVL